MSKPATEYKIGDKIEYIGKEYPICDISCNGPIFIYTAGYYDS